MTTYNVGLSPDQKNVNVSVGARPAGYANIGTFVHDTPDEANDKLSPDPDSHVVYHHVQDILGRTRKANPTQVATFPDNITDMASIAITMTEPA